MKFISSMAATASCSDTSTACPTPLNSRCRYAASDVSAAYPAAWKSHWAPNGLSGGSSGDGDAPGLRNAQPPALGAVTSEPRQGAGGPLSPNMEIDVTTSRGNRRHNSPLSNPDAARSAGGT